ncbi:DUF364 domain-containing protein [Candidatus Hecatella orcuttiae]|jgi:uncharacterized protein (DUF4213/DUF364 family)|uniref:DUF364 domain-containing protein n=1 Tax=Candidatus Hecatella orcuttiae TaxID=1935119 RepID=UPI002867C22D|nr:DUF364 domain-containing protein [Candidatus Hecatella orcuttiae]
MSRRIVSEVLDILEREISRIGEVKVEKVCLGLGYTGVKLTTGHAGVCHSLQAEMAIQCCQVVRRAGSLAGSPALDLAHLSESWDLGEKVVGVAALNALSQIVFEEKPQRYRFEERNLIDEIEIREGDTVAMVGNIKPFIPAIKSKTRSLYILERNPMREENVFPDLAGEEIIPKASVVIITGSAIANGTIDRLLELSRKAREIAISGPSASLIPDPLFCRGVKLIGGIRVTDPEKLFQIIAEGGGTPQIKPAVRFTIIKPG